VAHDSVDDPDGLVPLAAALLEIAKNPAAASTAT
jgi:hypothetical protein